MGLEGYQSRDVAPPETASGGRAVECTPPTQKCTAAFTFQGSPGWYDLAVQYFDQNNGASQFTVFVGDQVIDQWLANDHLPARAVGGDSSTRRWIRGAALRPGDGGQVQ